jgi:hypothetical protein
MTSWSVGKVTSSRFSAMVRPVTVRTSPSMSPSSSSARSTTGTPPMRSRSTMWYLPNGFRSPMCGVRRLIRSKSSSSSSTPASWAMASRWSTALVDPPRAMTVVMAFSKAGRVMIWRGRMLASSSPITASPDRTAYSRSRGSMAGTEADPGSDIPIASPTEAMVLAVNIPAQEPAPGQALRSSSSISSAVDPPSDRAPMPRRRRRSRCPAPVASRAGWSRRRGTRRAGWCGRPPSACRAATCRNRRW